jgi:hypothetical protein
VDAAVEDCEHRLCKPRRRTIITDCKRDGIGVEETSVESWIQWVFGPGFCLYSCFSVISHSFLVACFICWLGWLSEVILQVPDNGWDLGDMGMTVRRRRMADEKNHVLHTSWLGRICGG